MAWSNSRRRFEAIRALRFSRDPFSGDAESLTETDSVSNICCPLPFSLQDLCLLVVISELGSYPTELLETLPCWLRRRILNNVPALDLSRLELTPVASGVDTGVIWKARLGKSKAAETRQLWSFLARNPNDHNDDEEEIRKGNLFQLNISRDCLSTNSLSYICNIPGGNNLTRDIMKDISDVKDFEISIGNWHLLEIASALLTMSHGTDLENIVHQLVSVSGSLVLSNLLTDSLHQDGCHTVAQKGHSI